MLRFNTSTHQQTSLHLLISIHPMLRFNTNQKNYIDLSPIDFNTSYVTVQLQNRTLTLPCACDFNTSYVTVQQSNPPYFFGSIMYFNTSYVTVQQICFLNAFFFKKISIHPMLRFNVIIITPPFQSLGFQYILCYGSTVIALAFFTCGINISIHPMLRFNLTARRKVPSNLLISIHPMLRFNKIEFISVVEPHAFQYILCYGSTFAEHKTKPKNYHFNTSYVTVQQSPPLNLYPFTSISIHPMLRFNFHLNENLLWYISIHPMLRFNSH